MPGRARWKRSPTGIMTHTTLDGFLLRSNPKNINALNALRVTSECADDRLTAAAGFPSTNCPIPTGLKNEMSTGRGSFGRTFITSSYVSYLGRNDVERRTRFTSESLSAMAKPTRWLQCECCDANATQKTSAPQLSVQPSPVFIDARNHIADLNPESMSCASCVNLAHHTLSFPWANIFPEKGEP